MNFQRRGIFQVLRGRLAGVRRRKFQNRGTRINKIQAGNRENCGAFQTKNRRATPINEKSLAAFSVCMKLNGCYQQYDAPDISKFLYFNVTKYETKSNSRKLWITLLN